MLEIKAGYKKTDIGVIPEDWEIKSYGEVFEFLNTISNSRADLCFKGDFGYIHYGDIHMRWENTLDLEKNELPKIKRNKIKKLPPLLKDGDLVMIIISEDYKNIAKSVEIKNIGNKKVVSGLHTFLMRDKNNVFAQGIRGYIYKMPIVWKQFQKIAAGLSVFVVSKNNLKNVLIPIPKLEEQKAIATILSDMDGLIQSLELLLEKAKAFKIGMMQELLTGKTRLTDQSGITIKYKKTDIGIIPEDWEVVTLGSLFEITSSARVFQKEWKSSGIPFYRARELVVLEGKGKVDNKLFIDKGLYEKHKRSYGVPQVGDMLVTAVGTLGKVYVVDNEKPFYFKDGNIIWFKVKDKLNSNYLKQLYLTPFIKQQITDISAGSTVGTYTIISAKKTKIPLPKSKEQKAIAEVLSDIDGLIESYSQRLDKAKALKIGMMQELLTGKTRLINNKEVGI